MSPLFDACFIETNPQPIKTLLGFEDLCIESFRLPLTTMEKENRDKLVDVWDLYTSEFGFVSVNERELVRI